MNRVLPLLLLALLGCNARDASDLSRDAGKLAQTGARSVGNAQLAARVNAALAQRKGVDLSGLRVEAEGGTVTLSGTVRDRAEKTRVADTVRGIRGVERLVDRLRVK